MDNADTKKLVERLDLFDERLDHYRERLDSLDEEIQEIKEEESKEKSMRLAKSSHRWEITITLLVLIETIIGLIMLYNGFGH